MGRSETMSQQLTTAQAALVLFDKYADDIFEFGCYSLGNREDAADLVQEVFARVLRSWTTVRRPHQPKTWLWTIARNCTRDMLRRRGRRKERLLDPADMEPLYPATWDDTTVELQDVLGLLPVTERQVVFLRLVEDLSTKDTARILGWTSIKVRTTLHRAVLKLRRQLDDREAATASSASVQRGPFHERG